MKSLCLLFVVFFFVSCGSELEKVNIVDAYLVPSLTGEKTNSELSTGILAGINIVRQTQGLTILSGNTDLDNVAQSYAEDLAFGRVEFSSDESYRCDLVLKASAEVQSCTFVRAHGPGESQAILEAWLNSTSNKSKIEDSNMNYAGVGVMKDPDDKFYWVVFLVEVKT